MTIAGPGLLPNHRASEALILHDIRVALGREPDLVLWRLNQGITKDHTGKQYRSGMVPGAADLIGVLGPRGRWFCLEVKSPTGRLSREQKLFGSLVQRMGGSWACVRSVDDARAALDRARNGESG